MSTSTSPNTTTTKNDEPAYLPILNAAVSAMKVEFITNLEKYETNPDRVGNHRHFFPNKVSGQFRSAIENCYVIAAANANNAKSTTEQEQENASQKSSTSNATRQQNELDLFARDLLEAWKDLVQFIFLPPKDVRGAEKPVPIDLANWVADDLLFRMRGKKNTGYESFVRKRGLVFKGVIDEVRTTLGNTVPLNKAVLDFKRTSKQSQQQQQQQQQQQTSTASKADQQRQQQQQDKIDNQNNNNNSDVALQEEINRVGQKAKIPSIYSFSDYGSDASLDSKSAQNIPSPRTQSADDSGFESASSPTTTRNNNDRHHYNDNNTYHHHHQDHKRYHRQDQHYHHHRNDNNRSSSGHKVPIYKQIIKNQREENARIAQILQSIFSTTLTGDSVTKTISLHALYEICRAHDAIRPQKFQKSSQQQQKNNINNDDDNDDNDDNQSMTTNNFDERTHRQFSKRIFEIVQRGLVPDCHLAVTDTSVLNMTALIADNIVTPGKNDVLRPSVSSGNSNKSSSALAFPSAPVTTIAGEQSSFSSASTENLQQQQQKSSASNTNDFITLRSPIIVHDDPQYDPYFNILVHLLYTNFHIKPNKAKGIVPDVPYSGHNICCVVVDRQGKIVGMDFNQCKQDQNLCSHAEKRLGEALNEKLKKTVPPNTPPSLEEYTFISSLEPCHMCCNFISRLGVKTIAYLQADPMQCDALNIAASLLGLKVVRPSVRGSRFIAETMETAFKLSDFPEEEITSWLGSAECRKLLGELKQRASFAEGSECDKFMKKCGDRYPGVVVIDKPAWNSNTNNTNSSSPNKKEDNNKSSLNKDDRPNIIGSNENDNEEEDGEDMTDFGMIYSTSSVLAGIYGSSSTEDEEEAPNSEEDDS